MSTTLIENEIQRFLSTKDPEVLCITGAWGVGKTYAWNWYLKTAQERGAIGLRYYSYVSLFGITSLDDFKYAIFENSVNSSQPHAQPSLETLLSKSASTVKRFSKKIFGGLQKSSFAQNYVGGLGPMCFFSVTDTIICIDDVERRGDNLPIRDVLGLVSLLKEQKRCKIVLILNDEALAQEKVQFDTYFEKVVDARLSFAPSAEEAARIALAPSVKTHEMLSGCCIALGIANIRLIKKIQHALSRVEPMLREFDQEVLMRAVQSLTLFAWSVYEPGRAPSLTYLKNRTSALLAAVTKREAIPKDEAAWNALLDVYGFEMMDEFDLVLLDGIRHGFFDPSLVLKHASELNNKVAAAKRDNSFEKAWHLYHDSFENNQGQVLDAIYESFITNIQSISPINLSGTVTLFKDLGQQDRAAEIIEHYIASHGENRNVFDLESYPFQGSITDPDVIRAFNEKFATFKDDREPTAILLSIARRHGWNADEIRTLSTLPVEDYYDIFIKNRGSDLRGIIEACLQFDRIGNASEPMKEISGRAKLALARIGQESRINARRVAKYGVTVDVVAD